jgi:hypothetical protein
MAGIAQMGTEGQMSLDVDAMARGARRLTGEARAWFCSVSTKAGETPDMNADRRLGRYASLTQGRLTTSGTILLAGSVHQHRILL